MSSTGHYLKPGKKATAPTVVFTVVCDTKTQVIEGTRHYVDKTLSNGMVSVSKKRDGNWSLPKFQPFITGKELIRFIETHSDNRRRNYIFSPVVSDILTLCGLWDFFESKGILWIAEKKRKKLNKESEDYKALVDIRRCVIRGKPDILDYAHGGKRYIWLSSLQYIDADDETLGRSVAYTWLEDYYAKNGGMPDKRTLLQRCLLWQVVLRKMFDWWTTYTKAPWGLTAGALSMGVLRSNVKPKSLCTHKDESTHRIERSSCYGGRATIWYSGNIINSFSSTPNWFKAIRPRMDNTIIGPLHYVDVRSMYPFLLRDRMYPCKLIRPYKEMGLDSLKSYLSAYGAIATVQLDTHIPEYPYRRDDRISYPIGWFQTILCGPELERAICEGSVVRCYGAALYELGRPFREAADFLIEMRMNARLQANHADELFAKTLAVSLGGKLAQRKGTWIDRFDVFPERQWGEWRVINWDTQESRRFRSLCGTVQEYIRDSIGTGPYTASFAYLTAYGRDLMRQIRYDCPDMSVIQQDTDGLWVLGDSCLAQLKQKYKFGDVAGSLRVIRSSEYGRFFTPRHYVTDQGWKLSGFHNHTVDIETMTVSDSHSINPAMIGCRENPHTIREQTRSSSLTGLVIDGQLSPSGWVYPSRYYPPKNV